MAEVFDVGYNTLIKVGNKTFAGVTQDDLTLTGVVKESITKTNKGQTQKKVVRVDTAVKVAGICSTESEPATSIDREAAMDLVLAKAPLEVTYLSGSTPYTGTAIAVGYSESTSADPSADPTYSIDLQFTSELTKGGGA